MSAGSLPDGATGIASRDAAENRGKEGIRISVIELVVSPQHAEANIGKKPDVSQIADRLLKDAPRAVVDAPAGLVPQLLLGLYLLFLTLGETRASLRNGDCAAAPANDLGDLLSGRRPRPAVDQGEDGVCGGDRRIVGELGCR